MVTSKVRDKISNLKPSSEGYEVEWDRRKNEFGETKTVVNAHMEEIINMSTVKGTNYVKIETFYGHLSKNFDALKTLGESDMLWGFVLTTLNKLPQVKPDLVSTDDSWEDWGVDNLLMALQKWLKQNKSDDSERKVEERKGRREKSWCEREKDRDKKEK